MIWARARACGDECCLMTLHVVLSFIIDNPNILRGPLLVQCYVMLPRISGELLRLWYKLCWACKLWYIVLPRALMWQMCDRTQCNMGSQTLYTRPTQHGTGRQKRERCDTAQQHAWRHDPSRWAPTKRRSEERG